MPGMLSVHWAIISAVSCLLTWWILVAGVRGHVNIDTDRLGCHTTTFSYNVTKPSRAVNGRILGCEGTVTVQICGGRCDTSEIPDHRTPYKLSNHMVCSYTRHRRRGVMLDSARCDREYPDRSISVMDAEGCVCQYCNPRHTSCETLN